MEKYWPDAFEEMRRTRRIMEELFDEFFPSYKREVLPSPKGMEEFRRPFSELEEREDGIIAHIEIPGTNKEDIRLEITENGLEIKAEKKTETKKEGKGYSREERRYRGFYRKMSLPYKINPDGAKATYKDGVLEISMPRTEPKKLTKGKRLEIEQKI